MHRAFVLRSRGQRPRGSFAAPKAQGAAPRWARATFCREWSLIVPSEGQDTREPPSRAQIASEPKGPWQDPHHARADAVAAGKAARRAERVRSSGWRRSTDQASRIRSALQSSREPVLRRSPGQGLGLPRSKPRQRRRARSNRSRCRVRMRRPGSNRESPRRKPCLAGRRPGGRTTWRALRRTDGTPYGAPGRCRFCNETSVRFARSTPSSQLFIAPDSKGVRSLTFPWQTLAVFRSAQAAVRARLHVHIGLSGVHLWATRLKRCIAVMVHVRFQVNAPRIAGLAFSRCCHTM